MALTGVTNRKYLADLFPQLYTVKTAQRSVATVLLKAPAGGGNVTLDPVGQACIYDGAEGEYVLYRNLDTIPVTGDTALESHGAKVAIVAGGPQGLYDNAVNLVVTEAGVTATVVFREATCVTSRIDFHSGLTPTEETNFVSALLDQDIVHKDAATDATPSYTQGT